MNLLALFLVSLTILRVHSEDVPFKCDDTEGECPSKMCFYGLDHEKRCYRAGCAPEELCHGRRNNECFASKTEHTCCCLEAGCSARYKGLNDCVDELKNATNAATSATDVTTTTTTTTVSFLAASTAEPVTDVQTSSPRITPSATSTERASSSTAGETTSQSTARTSAFEPEPKTSIRVKSSSTVDARSTVTSSSPSSSTETSKTSEPERTTQSTSSMSSSRIAHPVTSPLQSSSKSTSTVTPRTARYTQPVSTTSSTTTTTARTTTTTTPKTTTALTTRPTTVTQAPVQKLRLLPDLTHREVPAAETTTERTTSKATTTTEKTTRTYSRTNVETFAEQKSRSEPENFFSPAMRNEKPQKPKSSEGSTRKTADGEKVATSSLISVYEVTTLAVKNRETQDGWKPPVPWWSAVAFGFLVSVIAAWAVVLFLKKKKQRETVSTNKTGDKEQGLVDPLLKPSDASEHESSRVSDNSRI